MPVPKRKLSKSRRDKRSACKFIRPEAFTKCANCDFAINPHQVCEQCGFYKGRKIMTTKLERTLKRGEAKKKQQAKTSQVAAENKDQNLEK